MQSAKHQIEIDAQVDSAYVRLSSAPIVRTQEIADGIFADFDANNQMVGVEVLCVRDRVGAGDSESYLKGLVAGLRLRRMSEAAE
jgi:uncharacterized protein YuzE